MNILETAIIEEGSVENLAKKLGVVVTAIYNWRTRGVPRSWEMVLSMTYRPDIPWGVSRSSATTKPNEI